MSLSTYHAKRNFKTTPEPSGGKRAEGNGIFMMHKHAARRLHYDLRLEYNGVLLSWAVTRGPSLNPRDKRLSVRVEDHPLDYANFEGIIPEGNYGAGATLIFDRGYWQPLTDVSYGLKKGHLQFELFGQKLAGRWHLVRLPQQGKQDNWLLIKADDDYSRDDIDITEAQPLSISSGLSIDDLKQIAAFKKAEFPAFIPPMLATAIGKPPDSHDWLHEIKFDGYRMQVHIEAGSVRLFSRQGNEWTQDLTFFLPFFARLACRNAIIDGELVVIDNSGKTNFSKLRGAFGKRGKGLSFYSFDLLYLNDRSLSDKPLIERRKELDALFGSARPPLYLSESFDEKGSIVFKNVKNLGLEGIISKKKSSKYVSDRSQAWCKVRCVKRQEFVVGGYTVSNSQSIASLLVGAYNGEKLNYYGRVGTGFRQTDAKTLLDDLSAMKTVSSPFSDQLSSSEKQGVIFVNPTIIVEVEYMQLTADGRLRHASFKGIRTDKQPREVMLEQLSKEQAKIFDDEAAAVKFTHLDRIYWPDREITKSDLIDYYRDIWPRISSHIVERPLSLLRCPDGIGGQSFFQKHPWPGMAKHIRVHNNLLFIDSVDGLLALVQSAVLELHPWGAMINDIEHCNRIIMDIDPDVSLPFRLVRAAAQEIRDRLRDLGLDSFVKTSGGKGLHVVSDLPAPLTWEDTKTLTQYIADAMSADSPNLYVAKSAKALRIGKMFIDHQRNRFGATAVAAYSTRARPLAPISMPVEWDALAKVRAGNMFRLPKPKRRRN